MDKEREEQEICCDKNTPCVPNFDDSNNENIVSLTTTNPTESLSVSRKKQQHLQQQVQNQQEHSHKGENCHSKNTGEGELDSNEKLLSNLKAKIKEDLEEQGKEQQILLKENKQNIIDFIIGNKESIKIEDLKIYGLVYKCYRKKGNCQICNSSTNIICKNCNNYKEIWLCTNHWQQHAIGKHKRRLENIV